LSVKGQHALLGVLNEKLAYISDGSQEPFLGVSLNPEKRLLA